MFKTCLMYTIRVSNSLDPDQARFFGRLDLVSNCYQQTTKVVTSEGVGARSPVVTSRIIVK